MSKVSTLVLAFQTSVTINRPEWLLGYASGSTELWEAMKEVSHCDTSTKILLDLGNHDESSGEELIKDM